MPVILNLVGQKFGRLTVIESDGRRGKDRVWKCDCECGGTARVSTGNLRSGNTKSCGCFQREQTNESHVTHGLRNHPLYGLWHNMIRRCTDPASTSFSLYGGRGIKVCERWHDFALFLADMGERPSSKHSIDRINNDGDYEPGNVRWATAVEQARNRRKRRLDSHAA